MAEQITVYESGPVSPPMSPWAARAFLHVWLDLALTDPAGQPVFCPRCRSLACAVAVGRGQLAWFRVEPCGCVCEIGSEW